MNNTLACLDLSGGLLGHSRHPVVSLTSLQLNGRRASAKITLSTTHSFSLLKDFSPKSVPFKKNVSLLRVSVFPCMSACVPCACSAHTSQKASKSPGPGAKDGCELLFGCWKLNQGLLKVLVTTEPPLYHQVVPFQFSIDHPFILLLLSLFDVCPTPFSSPSSFKTTVPYKHVSV